MFSRKPRTERSLCSDRQARMRRLYLQVYLTIVASLVLVVLTAGLVWHFVAGVGPFGPQFEVAGEVIAELVPPANAPAQAQQQAIDRLAARLGADLALFGRANEPLAAAGRPLPAPSGNGHSGWMRTAAGPAVSIPLPDGRRLVARLPPRHRPSALMLAAFLGAIALVVAIGARPVVRRLTGRLERLQRGVESLGAGDLTARVKVEGRDEVARLAQSFNQAATRIESLVSAHKILLASRLDTTEQLDISEDLDLAALTAEECARYDDCALEAKPVMVRGDPMLLRRMIRNLIENAKLHGRPPVEVSVAREEDRAALNVLDHGPLIAEDARERLFS